MEGRVEEARRREVVVRMAAIAEVRISKCRPKEEVMI